MSRGSAGWKESEEMRERGVLGNHFTGDEEIRERGRGMVKGEGGSVEKQG